MRETAIDLGGPTRDERGPRVRRTLRVLCDVLGDRREELLHDAWTVRSIFASPVGPFRRAGFSTSVLVRAAAAEMDRVGTLHGDPLDEAFWTLCEQGPRLNAGTVDVRAARRIFSGMSLLRPSQRRACLRLLDARGKNLAHPDGSAASNPFLLAVVAGGLVASSTSRAYCDAVEKRFPDGLPYVPRDEIEELLLPPVARERLDERALNLDGRARADGR